MCKMLKHHAQNIETCQNISLKIPVRFLIWRFGGLEENCQIKFHQY